MKLSIIIASHGDYKWMNLAIDRAWPSAKAQCAHEVLIGHDPGVNSNRAKIRNRLAAQATGDWLCFLDADDELAPGYADAMAEAERPHALLTPAVSYIENGVGKPPRFWPEIDLRQGNWMVVGTVLPKAMFDWVGGWRHLNATGVTNEYDDWELWIRCVGCGATPVKVPKAVYVAHIAPTSPHRTVNQKQKQAWFKEVIDMHFTPA